MMACEVWVRRDYLIRRGREPDEPPCEHDPQLCPPHDRRPDPKEHLMARSTDLKITVVPHIDEATIESLNTAGREIRQHLAAIADSLQAIGEWLNFAAKATRQAAQDDHRLDEQNQAERELS